MLFHGAVGKKHRTWHVTTTNLTFSEICIIAGISVRPTYGYLSSKPVWTSKKQTTATRFSGHISIVLPFFTACAIFPNQNWPTPAVAAVGAFCPSSIRLLGRKRSVVQSRSETIHFWGSLRQPLRQPYHNSWNLPSGYLLHSHGIDGPFIAFIDGLPITNGDFPWRTVSHNQMVDGH